MDHLRKIYRRVMAVDDLSFEVEAGDLRHLRPERSGQARYGIETLISATMSLERHL
jgi:hypothetical protein